MVIHDLKHPTESLISSFDKMLIKFDEIEHKLKVVERLCSKCSENGESSSQLDKSGNSSLIEASNEYFKFGAQFSRNSIHQFPRKSFEKL
jgi:hypothetical protein